MTNATLIISLVIACGGDPATTTTTTTHTGSTTTHTGTPTTDTNPTTTETAINPDADGDGFIAIEHGGDDCDDDDPDTNPWSIDSTLTDRNCDGILDGDLKRADHRFRGVGASDKAGSAIATAGDVDGDGKADILISAIFANSGTGAVYLYHGSDLNTLVTHALDDTPVTITGAADEYIGESVATAGDIDGDGLDDILIGSPYNTEEDYLAGKAVIFLGKSLPSKGNRLLSDADISVYGTDREQFVGHALSGAGDTDGDGVDDILVGAWGYNNNRGAVGVFSGASLNASSVAITDADTLLTGSSMGETAGQSLAGVGDVDGDGRADILIGAPNYNNGGTPGMTYLVYGASLDGLSTLSLQNADHRFTGEGAGDYSGTAVSGAGDVDGDGQADILIGAYLADDPLVNGGNSYLFLGASLDTTGHHSLTDADYRFTGEGNDHYAGFALSAAGDIDNDGFDDLLIGAPNADNADGTAIDAGRAYLLYGSTLGKSGDIALQDAPHILIGENGQDRVGTTVANAGDIDGDGFNDILIGAEQSDEGGTDSGKVYLILGAPRL